ncbi:MAG TPA: hypothetical protein VM327_05935 [Candidatus Thermoplasmatota archaeon]|nr:hypothetical protein [Candidatus Thermoplasmatota archaeon]
MRWLVVVAVFVLFAGCLEESAAPPVEAAGQPDEPDRTARQGRGDRDGRDDEARADRSDNVTLRSYTDQYAFTLTSANALVTIGNIQGYSCVAFEGAPFVVLNGTATLTWDAQSALTEELTLQVRTYWDSSIYETYSGPSSLVVEFRDLEVEPDPNFEEMLVFAVELAGPVGVAYEQDVTMDLAFEYESDIDIDPSTSYC